MSRLDDIKDQLQGQLKQTWEKTQESPIYLKLEEQYQNLSPLGQRLVQYAALGMVLFILVSIPYSNYSSSQSLLESYDDKRRLLRELMRTSREASQSPNLLPAPSVEILISQVESYLKSIGLLPEQIKGVIPQGSDQRGLIPKDLEAGVLQIQLAKLNLRQVIDIGARFSNLSSATKMKDMKISANADDSRYLDTQFTLYNLKVPERIVVPVEPEPKKGNSKNKKDTKAKEGSE